MAGIILIFSLLSGLLVSYANLFRPYIKPMWLKAFHNAMSCVAYIMGMISIINGYWTLRFASRADPGDMRFVMIWCSSFSLVFTMIGPLKAGWNYFRR